jgi:hypothetical protein
MHGLPVVPARVSAFSKQTLQDDGMGLLQGHSTLSMV